MRRRQDGGGDSAGGAQENAREPLGTGGEVFSLTACFFRPGCPRAPVVLLRTRGNYFGAFGSLRVSPGNGRKNVLGALGDVCGRFGMGLFIFWVGFH